MLPRRDRTSVSRNRGWRADPAQSTANHRSSDQKLGFDYIHVAVNDHSLMAYAEMLQDDKGPTGARFLTRAAALWLRMAFMASHGAPVRRVITDNAFAYRLSKDVQNALTTLATAPAFIDSGS